MPELLLMLFSTGAINKIYGMLAISFLIIVPWQLVKTGKAYVNGMASVPFYTLAVFGLLYFVIGEFSIQGLLYYMVCPLLAYLAGWVMVDARQEQSEKVIRRGIAALLLGYTIHAFLNYSINIGHQRWELNDFFTGSFRGATGSGCINTLALSLAAYILVSEKDKLKKLIGLACAVVSLLYAFLLGTRTQFIILFIVSFIFLFCYLYEKFGVRSVLILTAITLLLIGVGIYLYTKNIFGIKTYIDASNLMARYQSGSGLQSADGYRTSSLLRGLDNLLNYPFGGLKNTMYYHNLWLDVGRVGGILPFTCMVFYTVTINIHAFHIMKNKDVGASFRYLLLCVYLGIQINFFVEPILEGLLDFFLVFTFINGMVECYYRKSFICNKAA